MYMYNIMKISVLICFEVWAKLTQECMVSVCAIENTFEPIKEELMLL